ncbi:flavin reductase family protein [Streptomyces sp. NPDC006356]
MSAVEDPIDARRFRNTLSRFASGVVVVSGMVGQRPVGLAVQSFFSVSLDPPLVAISPSVGSGSWQDIASTGRFAVTVLGEDQRDLCLVFGRSGPHDRFSATAWHTSPSGNPLVDGALAWLDCDVDAVHPTGDHLIVVGRVRHMSLGRGDPLLFFGGRFGGFASHEPVPVARRADDASDDLFGDAPWLRGVDW